MLRKPALNRRSLATAAASVLVLGLGACATRTPVSGTFPPITPRAAQSGRYLGKTVRWGGILIATHPQPQKTCFRVMALPLASNGRPETGADMTETGRFIACAAGFYDPVLYAAGRRITFVGAISGLESQAVGGYRYPYPRLDARVVYLWPKPQPPSGYGPAYYYPMNYGWQVGGWWGPGWAWGYPWWGWPPPPPPSPRPPPPRPLPPPTPRPGHPPPAPPPPPPNKPPHPPAKPPSLHQERPQPPQ